MVRPPAKELTEREIEVMHVFWERGEMSAAEARDVLEESGLPRSYPTIANLIRILRDKEFLRQTNDARPFRYAPCKTHQDVSRQLLGDLIERVFRGSREELLLRLVEQRKLSREERELLESIIEEETP
jgi:predicted transcriptional regulator